MRNSSRPLHAYSLEGREKLRHLQENGLSWREAIKQTHILANTQFPGTQRNMKLCMYDMKAWQDG